jgi:MYXO-CTERM domain-containing protein
MFKKNLLIFAIAVAGIAGTTQAATITVGSNGVAGTPTGVTVETWIRSDNTTTAQSNNFQFVGSLAGGDDLRGLFAFDLSDPALDGVTINSVTVTIYQSETETGATGTPGSYDLDLTALAGSVNNSSTWNSASGLYDSTLVSITGDPTSVTQNAEFTFNSSSALVSYVQDALVSDTVQFGLKSDDLEALNERNFFAFGRTSTEPTTGTSASITITYVPEPGSLAVGLVGLGALAMRRRRG